MICENCRCEHDGSYTSGRFCSVKCARGFSTKKNRLEISKKVSKSLLGTGNKNVILMCESCGLNFETSWSKRNQKNCSISCSVKHRNMDMIISEETKNKISISVKKSYENGKCVYGGRTKWYNYKEIKVQGTYELRACNILDKLKNLGSIFDWEYTNDRIKYISSEGKERIYLLDFKVYETETYFYYIETKGYVTENDILKWKETRKKYRLDIWYGDDLIRMENNIKLPTSHSG